MANQFISNNPERTERHLTPSRVNCDGSVIVYQWESMEQEAEGLARIVEDLVKADKVKPGRVLILAPRRRLGYGVRDLLETKGVKAHSFFQEQALDGDSSVLTKSRTQQAFTLLTLAVNRKDSVALRCWCGFGSPNLREKAWKRIRALCTEDGLALSVALNCIQSGKLKIIAGSRIIERLNELDDRLQELAALRGDELFDALFPDNDPDFNQIRAINTGPDSDANAEQLLDRLRAFITQPELPTDVDFVRVMSLHKSKGLTADLVIVMGCIEGLIPNLPKASSEAEHRQILEEQRRLFYVSITRARKMLVLSSVTRLPLKEAYKMGLQVRRRQGHYAETITTRFIDELGPICPQPTSGVNSILR
jgi:DNA helicase-2/ATP-dependent DNA helicase PcrA